MWFSPGGEAFLVASSRFHLAVIDFGPWCTLHLENANETPLHPRQGMIHQNVISGHVQREIDDGSAASRDGVSLYPACWGALHVTQAVDTIEDFPNHVKGRGEIWTADAKEDAHRLADFCLHRMELGECTH